MAKIRTEKCVRDSDCVFMTHTHTCTVTVRVTRAGNGIRDALVRRGTIDCDYTHSGDDDDEVDENTKLSSSLVRAARGGQSVSPTITTAGLYTPASPRADRTLGPQCVPRDRNEITVSAPPPRRTLTAISVCRLLYARRISIPFVTANGRSGSAPADAINANPFPPPVGVYNTHIIAIMCFSSVLL